MTSAPSEIKSCLVEDDSRQGRQLKEKDVSVSASVNDLSGCSLQQQQSSSNCTGVANQDEQLVVPPQQQQTSSSPLLLLSARDFVISMCGEPVLAAFIPSALTLAEFATLDAEGLKQRCTEHPKDDFVGTNAEVATLRGLSYEELEKCASLAKDTIQTHLMVNNVALSPTRRTSVTQSNVLQPSCSSSNFDPQIQQSTGVSLSSSSASGAPVLSTGSSLAACNNPMARIFLRRTLSESTRRRRAPSCNFASSYGGGLRAGGFAAPPRSPGVAVYSFGHELSNLVRIRASTLGQSAPARLDSNSVFTGQGNTLPSSPGSEATGQPSILSHSTQPQSEQTGAIGRREVRRLSQTCHPAAVSLATTDGQTCRGSTASPTERPHLVVSSGAPQAGIRALAFHLPLAVQRRWSVASLPGSSGYGTCTGGSDGTVSAHTSSEALPASPVINLPARQRHHTTAVPPTSGTFLCPGRPSSTFSSTDSNPVFDLPAFVPHQHHLSSGSADSGGDVQPLLYGIQPNAPDMNLVETTKATAMRRRLSRKLSSPSLCSLGDDEVQLLNSIYAECFPKAKRLMVERLKSLLAEEQAQPAGPEAMDGAFCFVRDHVIHLVTDCLRAASDNALSSEHFAELSANLGQLAKQAKQKCPLSAPRLLRVIKDTLMAIARPARICECLEFSPDSILRMLNEEGLAAAASSYGGAGNQMQSDIYRYVAAQLGDVGLSGELSTPAFFNFTPGTAAVLTNLQSQPTPATSEQVGMAVAAPTMEDFDVVKLISNGAYAAVYLVRQKKSQKLFAMKRISKQNAALRNQLFAERNIMTFADNPFVVQLYCSFETEKHFCMVMEYVQGGDLASLLRKVQRIPVELARVYFAELVLALEYLHSYGIIHRDIKPDNLLITATGHIKLTDFGLSKIGLMSITTTLYECGAERLFKDQQVYGTPQYIAPEVILGQDYGKPVDWWSVGVVLYECLLAGTPFYGNTPEEVFYMIAYHEAIEWPAPEDPLYPTDDSKSFIEALLRIDPELRLGTAGAYEVKSHEFFASIEWSTILRQKAEMLFVPQLDSDMDTCYFDARSDRYRHEDPDDNVIEDSIGGDLSTIIDAGYTMEAPVPDSIRSASDSASAASDFTYHSFASFSPRYARDSFVLSSGGSSPLAASMSSSDMFSTALAAAVPETNSIDASNVGQPTIRAMASQQRSVPVITEPLTASSRTDAGESPPDVVPQLPNTDILSLAANRTAPAKAFGNRTRTGSLTTSSTTITPKLAGQQLRTNRESLSLHIPHANTARFIGENRRTSGANDTVLTPSPLFGEPPSSFATVTIMRGPRGFGFTFRTVRVGKFMSVTPEIVHSPSKSTATRKMHLQHQILSVQHDSPAACAGLQPGHIIWQINGRSMDGKQHIDVLQELVGSRDTITVHTVSPEVAAAKTGLSLTAGVTSSLAPPFNRPRAPSGSKQAFRRQTETNKSTTPSGATSGTAAVPLVRNNQDSKLRWCDRQSLARHSSLTMTPDNSRRQRPPDKTPNTTTSPVTATIGTGALAPASYPRMQKALSQTTLRDPVMSPQHRRQLLAVPTLGSVAATSGANSLFPPSGPLLSASLPQQSLSHLLASARAVSGAFIEDGGSTTGTSTSSMGRRRSFQTAAQSPLARSSSPGAPHISNKSINMSPQSSGGSLPLPNQSATALPGQATPLSPQRACSPLVQEAGLRLRNAPNRRVQSVYVSGGGVQATHFNSPQNQLFQRQHAASVSEAPIQVEGEGASLSPKRSTVSEDVRTQLDDTSGEWPDEGISR